MAERSWPNAQKLLRILFVASLVFPIALVGLTFLLDYATEWREARGELGRQTRIAADNAARAFEQQVRVADRITQLLSGKDAAQVKTDELAIHQALLAVIAPFPDIDGIVLIGRGGHALAAANVYPMPPLNLSERDYFAGTLAAPSGRYIGAVMTGSVIKRRFFTFSTPWRDSQGKILGVITILVSPRYFEDFYSALLTGAPSWTAGQSIALLTARGTLLAGNTAAVTAAVAARDGFLAAIGQAPEGGTFRGERPNGRAVFAVYQRVAGVPLYVVAILPEAAVIAAWSQEAAGHLLVSVPVALLFALLAGVALQRVQREEAAHARLGAEMERRAAAEETLLRSQRLEAVGQVTGGVAHDFNNLLTIIMGCAELLERKAAPPGAVRLLARNIRDAAERGADITASLLAFSRRRPVCAEVVDVNLALLAFAPLLRRAAKGSVAVVFDLAPEVSPVSLDPGQFEAAILNLVGNARDALECGGRITIGTRSTENAGTYPEVAAGLVTIVSVTDDGAGMDPTTAARAIEPFFTTKEVGRGTGLGLSQVYGFIRQSGGAFLLETKPGEGTTVRLVLPACAADAVRAAPAPVQAAAPMARGEVVLVVEDEARVRAIAVEVLRHEGYRTLDAPTVEAALALLRENARIDLLFSDIVLPGAMSGLDLAGEARRLHPTIRILLTSGYEPESQGKGPLPFLSKPYDAAALTVVVREVLDGPLPVFDEGDVTRQALRPKTEA